MTTYTKRLQKVTAVLCTTALLAGCAAGTSDNTEPAATTAPVKAITIEPTAAYQTMNGFGASACWWSQEVGNWENAKDILSLLYDKNSGIGLNIYRYNLGAGSKDDATITDPDRRAEAFIDKDGSYHWERDAAAQNALALAKSMNEDLRVTLFSNSAPVFYTANGKAYCDYLPDEENYVTNLEPERYADFAKYSIACAKHFTEAGYRVTGLSPINEPEWSWRGYEDGTAKQEGCYYSKAQCRDLYKVFLKQMAQEDALKDCRLEGWESGHIGTDTCMAYLQTMFGKSGINGLKNGALRKGMPTLALHSYWASPEERQAFADAIATTYGSNYKLALTEYCQMTEDQNSGVYDLIQKNGMDSGLGMEYGLALAGIIHQDLTVLNAVEWDWWTACAFGGYTDGLVYLDKDSHQVETSKRLWVLGNFSKFTDEGSVRISITLPKELSDVQSVAFKNPNGTVTAVFINNTDKARSTTLALDGYTRHTTYVTDKDNDLAKTDSGTAANAFALPARSVTTLVLEK